MLVAGTEHIPGSPKVSPEKICDYACCCDNNDCFEHVFCNQGHGPSSICPRHHIYRSGRRCSRRLHAKRVSIGSLCIYLPSNGSYRSAVAGPRDKNVPPPARGTVKSKNPAPLRGKLIWPFH